MKSKNKRQFIFDMDVILRICERFGVKVEKGENLQGVTMNGKPFDVTEAMKEAMANDDQVRR